MMNLRRRFVNLVAKNCTTSECPLHRLDVSEHLFYPSTAEAEAAARPAVVSTLALLPAPTHNFRPAVAGRYIIDQHIFALANPRRSEGRIFWRSQEGHTLIHDVDSHTTELFYDNPCEEAVRGFLLSFLPLLFWKATRWARVIIRNRRRDE